MQYKGPHGGSAEDPGAEKDTGSAAQRLGHKASDRPGLAYQLHIAPLPWAGNESFSEIQSSHFSRVQRNKIIFGERRKPWLGA